MIRRKLITLFLIIVFGTVVYFSSNPASVKFYDMPNYYLKNAFVETGSTNVVTAIYLNYRYYDTIFEALMLLFSIIGVIYMSIHEGGDPHE